MGIGAFWISMGSLAVAGFSVWLAHRQRSAPHREYLYERQAQAFVSVLDAIHPLYGAIQKHLAQYREGMTSEARSQLRRSLYGGELSPLLERFREEHQHAVLFLPESVHRALGDFNLVLIALSAAGGGSSDVSAGPTEAPDHLRHVSEAYEDVLRSMRCSLGVQPLSKQIVGLVGAERQTLDWSEES